MDVSHDWRLVYRQHYFVSSKSHHHHHRRWWSSILSRSTVLQHYFVHQHQPCTKIISIEQKPEHVAVIINMKSFLSLIIALVALAANINAFMSISSPSYQRTSPLEMTVLTYGAKKKNFKAGSPMKKAAAGLGIKPRYSCKKGDCNSCVLSVGGQRVKACVGKVPPEPRLKSLQEKGLEVR